MKRKTAKEILAESLKELMESRPIDKITVKEITENCGYSTATFYRQCRDKYDLIAWAYSQDLEKIMDRISFDEKSWLQALSDAAEYYSDHKEYLANLLIHTSGYDSFVSNMTDINYTSFKKKILQSDRIQTLDVETEMLLNLYVIGSVRLTCEWILGKYQADTMRLAKVYEISLPEPLKQYLH